MTRVFQRTNVGARPCRRALPAGPLTLRPGAMAVLCSSAQAKSLAVAKLILRGANTNTNSADFRLPTPGAQAAHALPQFIRDARRFPPLPHQYW